MLWLILFEIFCLITLAEATPALIVPKDADVDLADYYQCFSTFEDSFVLCPRDKTCENTTLTVFGVKVGPVYSCGALLCGVNGVGLGTCGTSSPVSILVEDVCCCNWNYCNRPQDAPPLPPVSSTVPPTPTPAKICYTGSLEENEKWAWCSEGEYCGNWTSHYANGSVIEAMYDCWPDYQCRGYGVQINGCHEGEERLSYCCCDSDYCNNPKAPQAEPTKTTHTTTLKPTTPTPAHRTICFSDLLFNGSWVHCQPGEVCTNLTFYTDTGIRRVMHFCNSVSNCHNTGAEINGCVREDFGQMFCCCDGDYCNNPFKDQYTPTPFTFPTPAPKPVLTCYDDSNGHAGTHWIPCPAGQLCGNATNYVQGVVAKLSYSCMKESTCRSHGSEPDSCNTRDGVYYCCCKEDYCNNAKVTHPTDKPTKTTTLTSWTTQKKQEEKDTQNPGNGEDGSPTRATDLHNTTEVGAEPHLQRFLLAILFVVLARLF